MTLTDAQKQALDKLPLTYDAYDPTTTKGVQWRTAQALVDEGLATLAHRGMSVGEHRIEVIRVGGGSEA